jgi:saccharopine dehydrogenase-like NADP-dependent oxidoreductase
LGNNLKMINKQFRHFTEKIVPKKVLILGGYGKFGSYIIKNIAECENVSIIVNGRSKQKCEELISSIINPKFPISSSNFDISKDFDKELEKLKPELVVHTAGPFQAQDYSVPVICIKKGINYIDLSDGREWVSSISAFNEMALISNVSVISGASSVPCLSSAIIDRYLPEFQTVKELEYAISTPSYPAPGLATLKSVLSYIGKPLETRIENQNKKIYGWQNMKTYKYPIIGRRLLSNCDIPDLELFQNHYINIQSIRFYAGLGNWMFHSGLWGLSWLV